MHTLSFASIETPSTLASNVLNAHPSSAAATGGRLREDTEHRLAVAKSKPRRQDRSPPRRRRSPSPRTCPDPPHSSPHSLRPLTMLSFLAPLPPFISTSSPCPLSPPAPSPLPQATAAARTAVGAAARAVVGATVAAPVPATAAAEAAPTAGTAGTGGTGAGAGAAGADRHPPLHSGVGRRGKGEGRRRRKRAIRWAGEEGGGVGGSE